MRRDIEALTTELIGLPKRERLEIARFLLFIDNRSSDSDDIESVWEEEITALPGKAYFGAISR
uniref:Addiction module component n=1 Tax=Candidatus Kentrum sp. TUN TaxID=2126343 RepID=A0A450ZXP8_9GAMM|nr:MAG: hypothetical protein BECKTUN1418F_GA0071002_11478 [Candidatus Kentron sp. TUN]VFK66995.1 MAG: hypothetical protein BECKTUN1418E_GA0071001_11279 [Candidatus Kentron sp. TUN]